jgi:signal transduction histidine kinase
MNFFIFSTLINGILASLFGFFVYLKNRKSLVNKKFFLMCIGVGIWSFSYVKWLLVQTKESALFWSRMLNFGATLIPIFYLHWVLAFLNLDKKKRGVIIFGYLITFIFLLFSFTPYYIQSVKPVLSFPYWPQAGSLYVCFIILGYIGLIGYGLYQLFENRKTAIKEKRNQIDYIILGTILGFGGGATNFPLMFGISLFPPYGQPLVSVYPIIFTFAIYKYHLFGIRVLLTELLVGLMGIILFLQVIFARNLQWRISSILTFLLFLIFAYYLVKSVHEEEKRREEAEKLAQKERDLAEKFQVLAIRLMAVERSLREIAERERMLRESAEKLSQAKTEFIAIVSHQLRTPLTIISGYLSMILDGDYGEIPQKLKEIIKKILESSQRLIRLVNSILDVSKIEAGEMEMNFERIDLREIAREVVDELKMKAKEKNLYLELKEPKEKIENLVDKEKIREVVLNLLDNAIKYTQKGKIIVRLKRIKEKNVDQISVKDEGEGMTKEELEKLFEKFSRGKAGMKFWLEGAGLGLFVSKSFVEMHGGRIWAESEGKGKGSTFYVELPIRENHEDKKSNLQRERNNKRS